MGLSYAPERRPHTGSAAARAPSYSDRASRTSSMFRSAHALIVRITGTRLSPSGVSA
ncbi:hypothetical protein SAMN05216483_4112 [Streptomyces sp. 2131.1]|nr:hypothetical protein SAMN05216483_4112 [Streptomyces sp. 2131.1]